MPQSRNTVLGHRSRTAAIRENMQIRAVASMMAANVDARSARTIMRNAAQPSAPMRPAAVYCFPRGAEQNRERESADERRQRLPAETRRLRIDGHAAEVNDAAGNPAVKHECNTDAYGNAEETQHRVGEPGQTCDIVGIHEVADTVDKRNSGNQWHDCADDDVAEAVTEADPVKCDT